ncbi:AAA family ATPase [Streptomyces samsunensis]|uniref:AAA family ATPase n=1 Tax=Streptomyces malaysiensis TaxID=92644 RepID=UPI00158344B2|nr:AAA family ATPase [Streptomyces samsunensis]NUH42906.1 AAA family ATPase [Streptomyces samsunensis]
MNGNGSVFPLPEPAVYVLVGAAGSGKTRVAAAFPRAWRLSLDVCRARVADDAGLQAATPAAVDLFDAAFAGRLQHAKPTVVDCTNTEQRHRVSLVKRAHSHGMPAVAIVARTSLAVCQARQATRPENRQVPPHSIERQHQDVPSEQQLVTEGFDHVHDADQLDLMRLLLERAAAAGLDPLVDVRATFGPDLADAFAFDPDSEDSRGAFTIAGRTVAVRWSDDGDPFDHHWQARLDSDNCPACGRALWVRVTGAQDLLDAYIGRLPDDPLCAVCDLLDYDVA